MRVEHLTHTYGENTPFCRSAVKDVNMEILEGEFLGIIGHTGSGKSTLIQHLNGLLKPTSGKICLGDRDIWADPKKIRDVRFRVGLVFQYPEYQLFEETAYKDISFGPKNMGLDEGEIDRRVRAAAGGHSPGGLGDAERPGNPAAPRDAGCPGSPGGSKNAGDPEGSGCPGGPGGSQNAGDPGGSGCPGGPGGS